MRVLTLDIETGPHLGYVWSLWKQNVSLSQLKETGEVLSVAAKWLDGDEVLFFSNFHDGHAEMVQAVHDLVSEADVIVHYNGKNFDMKHLNREFVESGMGPPAPYQQVDLLQVVRQQFRFPSNKLDYVCQALGLGQKETHTGFTLWSDCLAGDADAWNLMKKYNMQDVVITEKLYLKLLPWITSHPGDGLYSGVDGSCPNCGGTRLEKRGFAFTLQSSFQRYRCHSCGKWSRGTERLNKMSVRGL